MPLPVIAWIGGITALLAALIATQQNDIKRILAYSTLSQLGYMVMAVGLASDDAAMFHLTTHAFFKALLFLGAGSVIVVLHHEQDIWKMGGLRRKLPITFVTFVIGTLALIGVPPFSGFFSKDAILSRRLRAQPPIFGSRCLPHSLPRSTWCGCSLSSSSVSLASTAPPRPGIAASMPVPLVGSRDCSLVGGFDFLPRLSPLPHERDAAVSFQGSPSSPCSLERPARLFSIAVARSDPSINLLRHKFYFDELYRALINATQGFLARVSGFIDRWIIDATVVRGSSGATWGFGALLRLMQVGNLAGLRVHLRSRNYLDHLLCTFPLMLLLLDIRADRRRHPNYDRLSRPVSPHWRHPS